MEELLATKLFPVHTGPGHVRRPRLINRLEQGSNGKLTLISAPAGFGKSMLLGEWINGLQTGADKTVWFSLDENDNDTGLFFAYLITGLIRKGVIPSDFGNSTLKMISTPKPPVREILTILLNELADQDGKLILILDDFHLIESGQIFDCLAFLIEHSPTGFHTVVATRDDPPLPLARLRAYGQLNELRAVDLRFSPAEITAYMNRMMNLNLTSDEIKMLESRSEGWIAGIQLAAISMKGRTGEEIRREPLKGSNPFVLDYLLTEVLDRQSEDIRQFLLKTSILERFTGELCGYLTDTENGQTTLQNLLRANMFITPLDNSGEWFRYHNLFSDLLRIKLNQKDRSEISVLHKRASQWFEENSCPDEAVEHAVRAEDYQRAIDLFGIYVNDILNRGKYAVVWRWLDAIPADSLRSQPEVCILKAWRHLTCGRLDESESYLQAAENSFGDGKPSEAAGRAAAVRAFIAAYRGDIDGVIRNAERALSFLPPNELNWRSLVSISLGDAFGMQGKIQQACKARMKSLDECRATGNFYLILLAGMKLAITYRMQGHLSLVIDLCRGYYQQAEKKRFARLDVVGWLNAVWAETLAETGMLDEALGKGQLAARLTDESGDIAMSGWSLLCLIKIYFSMGKIRQAEEALQRLDEKTAGHSIPPYISGSASAWHARILLARNNIDMAVHWSATNKLSPGGELSQLNEAEYIVFSRILLAQNKHAEALSLLQRLYELARKGGWVSKKIEILILTALTHESAGEEGQALKSLEQALIPAEDGGFFRIFINEGPPLERLLYKLFERKPETAYVRLLLTGFSGEKTVEDGNTPSMKTDEPVVEQLSGREAEVLRLLSGGMSRQQMADSLFVSPHTIKTHLRNIYGKLGVKTQIQAVNRGRELGIINPD